MMSVKAFSASMAANYYEKDGYYSKSINAKDAWGGKLAKHQGLVGEVDAKVFKAVIETSGSAKCAGYDLTMSAPKSCSIALGSMREIRMDMTECHIAAVKKVMDKVESEAIKTRVIIAEQFHERTRMAGSLDLSARRAHELTAKRQLLSASTLFLQKAVEGLRGNF